jgi:glycosyltransferase involved in cell wall biosynthesis
MPEHEATPRIRALCGDVKSPFLLHVGGNQWYKNRLGVLRMFSRMLAENHWRCLKLIMVGSPWTTEMREFVSQNSLTRYVYELTGVSDEELRALYSQAQLMLFPSIDEGFGWPIIEAQACGCPVVTTNRAPMNEVGGVAAMYIDPENIESATAKIREVLADRLRLRSAGFSNAGRFSASGMVQSYVKLYRRLLDETSERTPPGKLQRREADEAAVHTMA